MRQRGARELRGLDAYALDFAGDLEGSVFHPAENERLIERETLHATLMKEDVLASSRVRPDESETLADPRDDSGMEFTGNNVHVRRTKSAMIHVTVKLDALARQVLRPFRARSIFGHRRR